MHYRFAFDENGECMYQVFNTCRDFIRTFPALVHDEKKVEDVRQIAKITADEAMSAGEPISPRLPVKREPMPKNPLETERAVRIFR